MVSNSQLHEYDSTNVLVADAQSSNYLNTLEGFPEIRTVFYEDSIENISHYLRPKYYDYMSNDCKVLEMHSSGGGHFWKKLYASDCQKYFNQTWSGHGLSNAALSVGLPTTVGDERDGKRIVTFIHLIPQAISFESGEVMHGNLKIIPQRCQRNISKISSAICGRIPVYKEVFTISQFWGKGFYHGTLEDLPRMALYLPFLLKHPHIRIQVAGRMPYLTLLGIHNSRLITEPVIKADILYMPPGGPCVEMFSRALIVIGPHGAGASNLLLSQPGTLFIEGLCYDSTNRTNLCYRNMAQALGLRYYGLIYPDQCMAITANQIETPLLEFLRAAVEKKLILR
ncbi:hypothetical protein LSH36_161g03004 [Paralvinella palmiformis]|uniref:Glycosyltransferase family 61 protein n=1 Tax=Paralvinella palmiformis TaxID=53620 RepID=A0AAD9JTG2_9ANNE|nr:hypothetical protein LSH36_161g03004 [Paralvinella palmiformis]